MDVLSPIAEHAGAGAERMPSSEISERFLADIEPHRRILYKVARTYGRSAEEREDIVQETVVQLWRAYPRYDSSQVTRARRATPRHPEIVAIRREVRLQARTTESSGGYVWRTQ